MFVSFSQPTIETSAPSGIVADKFEEFEDVREKLAMVNAEAVSTSPTDVLDVCSSVAFVLFVVP